MTALIATVHKLFNTQTYQALEEREESRRAATLYLMRDAWHRDRLIAGLLEDCEYGRVERIIKGLTATRRHYEADMLTKRLAAARI